MNQDIDDVQLRQKLDLDGFKYLEDYRDPEIFQQVDGFGRRRRVVLLGAGASVEAGLPTGPSLLQELKKLPEMTVFGHAARVVNGDVERAVQLLELAAQSDEPSTLGNALTSLGLSFPLRQPLGASDLARTARRELEAVRDHVRSRFWLPDDTDVSYLRPLLIAQTGGTIATLNYDNTLELAGARNWGYPEQPISITANDRRDAVRILNLHGSIGWQHLADHARGINEVRYRPEWQDPSDLTLDYQPAIIFGAGNKLRSYGPYLMLYSTFQQSLNASRSLITIGYAWKDDHINDIIRRWATTPVEPGEYRRRLVVGIGPDGRSLPPVPADLTRDHSAHVEVRPFPGNASTMIADLFGTDGDFGCSHIEQFREYWCTG